MADLQGLLKLASSPAWLRVALSHRLNELRHQKTPNFSWCCFTDCSSFRHRVLTLGCWGSIVDDEEVRPDPQEPLSGLQRPDDPADAQSFSRAGFQTVDLVVHAQ